MNADSPHSPEPIRIIQPCSEACTCYQALRGGRWADFGLCSNPASPFHGNVVRIGRECPRYRTDPPRGDDPAG